MNRLQQSCLWWQQLSPPKSEQMQGDMQVDVAIIGAGFTGLWTAWFLKQLKPDWSIALFEQHHVGYGATGRNGGWLIGGMAGQDRWLAQMPETEQRQARQLLYGIVESVRSICQQQQIDCDLQHQGVLYCAARYADQHRIAREWLHTMRQAGHEENDFRWLTAAEAEPFLHLPDLSGAIYSPHCATLNPAKLATGLAQRLTAKGVRIFTNARVNQIGERVLQINDQYRVNCATTVVATEAFKSPHQQLARKRLPVFSAVVGTGELSEAIWQQTIRQPGLAFADCSRSVTYGQRTANNELVFGARGGYLFGKRAQFEFDTNAGIFNHPMTFLQRLLPDIPPEQVRFQWAGSLSMSRRFSPFAGYDPDTGLAAAGGYGGEGVGASHLFGQTLAELICGGDSERTRQPWVSPQFLQQQRNWEPEPVPWLAYKAIGSLYALEDKLCHQQQWPWLHKPMHRLNDWLDGFLH